MFNSKYKRSDKRIGLRKNVFSASIFKRRMYILMRQREYFSTLVLIKDVQNRFDNQTL